MRYGIGRHFGGESSWISLGGLGAPRDGGGGGVGGWVGLANRILALDQDSCCLW